MDKKYRQPQVVEYGSVLELVHEVSGKGTDILEGMFMKIKVDIVPVPTPAAFED